MSRKHHLARALAAAMAALVVALAVVAPALADVMYGKGYITISNVTGNTTTFTGYQLFKANVEDDSTQGNTTGKKESNIAWYNDDVASAVKSAVSTWASANGKTAPGSDATAQDYAEFIVENVTGTTNTTRVENASLANAIADALDNLTENANNKTITAGSKTQLDEGYWLFVTTPSTIDTGEAGTAPIFAVVGGSDVTVNEKTTLPTVTKQVTDDAANATASDHADAQVGQLLTYTLTGTIADNVKTYKTYEYTFTDTLTNLEIPNNNGTLTGDAGFSVKIGDTVVKSGYTVKYENSTLTVSFDNLKAAKDENGDVISLYNDDGTSTKSVVVTYKARLTSSATQGGNGNSNSVTLTYSNNPNKTTTSTTTEQTTKTYTYSLKLVKVDRTTEVKLSGAKFVIRATDPDEGTDSNNANKYVVATAFTDSDSNTSYVAGELGPNTTEINSSNYSSYTNYVFTTDSNGEINVSGLDAGTYTVTEVLPPTNDYKPLSNSFTFTITPSYSSGSINTVAVAVSFSGDANTVVAGPIQSNTSENVLKATEAEDSYDSNNGVATVTVGNVKRITLPLTGLDGVTVTWVVGGVVLAATVAFAVRSRRRDGDEA